MTGGSQQIHLVEGDTIEFQVSNECNRTPQ